MTKFSGTIAVITFCLSVGLTGYSQEEQEIDVDKINEVIKNIEELYVDDVASNQFTDDVIRTMLEKLDPHSVYIPKDEVQEANQSINGNFVGVGIRFQILKDTLMVVQTIPGGPSEKVGLLAGDKITGIDGENVAGIGLKNQMVRDRLLGDKGTKVKVEVNRKNNPEPLVFTITRDKIPVNSVDAAYMIQPGLGYIKLNAFSRTTIQEIQISLRKLKAAGMTDLILDLQGNGGGLMYAAQILADEFLSDDKLIVYSEGKARPRKDLNAGLTDLFEEGRLVVLTNEYSASASEIVSGAIQDWDRGLIVGRRTYGKGLVQQPIDLSDGSQVRLTIARYYTPTGRSVQKPYDNVDDYRKDLLNRYENGEFMHADSIKLPDSLKFKTFIKGRTIYGGGGVMPDVFVPLDTSDVTNYYSELVRSGSMNSFVLEYVNKNRKALQTKYPNFTTFKDSEITDKQFMSEYFNYLKKEYPTIKFNKKQFKISQDLIKLRLKASMAQTLWGYAEFYEIYNESNEILQKAIEILTTGKYNELAGN